MSSYQEVNGDDKAQEKIKNYAAKWFNKGREYGEAPITKDMLMELEEDGEKLLSEFNYRKLPDKPPLLSDEKLNETYDSRYKISDGRRAVAQAQREADIKHYEDLLSG